MQASAILPKNTGSVETGTDLVQFLYLVLGIKVLWVQLQNRFIILEIKGYKQSLFDYNVKCHAMQTRWRDAQEGAKMRSSFFKQVIFVREPHLLEHPDGL